MKPEILDPLDEVMEQLDGVEAKLDAWDSVLFTVETIGRLLAAGTCLLIIFAFWRTFQGI